MRKVWLVAAGVILGLISARILWRPDPELARLVQEYRAARPGWVAAWQALGRVVAARGDTILLLDRALDRMTGRAAVLGIREREAREVADSLRRERVGTLDPTLRLATCEAEVAVRERQAATCAERADSLAGAVVVAREGEQARDRTIADLLRGRGEDSLRLAKADSIADRSDRVLSGCRVAVPLVGRFHCPAVGVLWSWREPELLPRYLVATYPVRGWLQVGVAWDRRAPLP